MDIFAEFERRLTPIIVASFEARGLATPDLARVVVEAPRDTSHGDLSTNAAMVLTKSFGGKPRDLAEAIAQGLAKDPDVASVDIAGPGFINIRLQPAIWLNVFQSILQAGERYGIKPRAGGASVNVEYVSANPTGPMHVGHARGAVVGDAIASTIEAAGRTVVREYYINDAGAQVDVLARSVHLRYREALGEDIGEIPPGLYPGEYLRPLGEALAAEYGPKLSSAPEGEWLSVFRQRAIDAMMAMIREDLAALSIHHDVFFSERSLIEGNDRVLAAVDALRASDHVYQGVVPPPKGELPDDWEEREQTLFRSTAFGDDVDRPLMKSDGSYTYFASDIAYHASKFDRGFAEMIDIWGADHGGYVKRMTAAVTAMTGGRGALDVLLCQLVRLTRNGEPVKMSKRSGSFVTLREVVDEVGPDAVRFMMLMRKADAPVDFDLAKVVEQSKDNAVFYVQYAHARAHSIYRNAELAFSTLNPRAVPPLDVLALITDPIELGIIKRLAAWPRMVVSAAQSREPHRIAFYLNDLAAEFHQLWSRGRDLPHLRFINDNDALSTSARVALVRAVQSVVSSGLGILGVSAPDEMR
jgi:arginyl-tRNA synthetase